jgi:hypothetical protein
VPAINASGGDDSSGKKRRKSVNIYEERGYLSRTGSRLSSIFGVGYLRPEWK